MTARLRTVRLLALATAAVLGLAGCGSLASDPEASATPAEELRLPGPDPAVLAGFPEEVRTRGTLVLAVDPHYPPSAFTDPDGEIVGVGADFAADGTFGRILSRWGNSGAAVDRSQVNPGGVA